MCFWWGEATLAAELFEVPAGSFSEIGPRLSLLETVEAKRISARRFADESPDTAVSELASGPDDAAGCASPSTVPSLLMRVRLPLSMTVILRPFTPFSTSPSSTRLERILDLEIVPLRMRASLAICSNRFSNQYRRSQTTNVLMVIGFVSKGHRYKITC
jgi:hypothetical protein